MNISHKIRVLTRLAILVAIIFLLSNTPLGYVSIGPIAATTVQIPVIIGAILLGPLSGAILGFFFGLSALIKVLTVPGADAFATMVMQYSPFAYLFVCMVPRILMGWLSGLLAAAFKKLPRNQNGAKSKLLSNAIVHFSTTGFVGSMLNTVFYLGSLWLLASEVIATAYGTDLSAVGGIVMTTAVTAGIPEGIISAVVVSTVCKAMEVIFRRQPTPKH